MAVQMNETKPQVAALRELSLKGLARLYDEKQGMFNLYVKDGKLIPMPLSWSICYTAISVLGLNKVRCNGWLESIPFNEQQILGSLASNWKKANEFGHLGLIQWAIAECSGQYAKDITDEIVNKSSVESLKRLPTTEIAWILTGLCLTYQKFCQDENIKGLAALYHRAISENFNIATGLFCHTREKASRIDLRSHIGNFADQIYSIFALSTYYETFNDRQALQLALHCAECVCSLQGEQGQWWWHYHSKRGGVASRYPVYSVHQDGMGPMGLQKLAAVSGKDFQPPIRKGLNWLFSANELKLDIVDWDNYTIWRDIEPMPAFTTRYISILLGEIGLIDPFQQMNGTNRLKLNREMRPYELGWLLYAFADQPAA